MGLRQIRVLVLWDVDHTLLETRGVGGASFRAAFERVTGCPVQQMPHITGRTEPDIYHATAQLHGIATPPPFDVFARALLDAYTLRQSELAERGRVLPGAKDALMRLAEIPNVHQSVLTGNTRAVARLKLETFGLTTHLDLESGAYGDDDGFRPPLVAIARSRAAKQSGTSFDQRNTVLIGDSPGDIDTARRGGARVIAVAAGGTPASELMDADAVLGDLTDLDVLVKALRV
ncbi:HAD family hydrolase [Nocardia sp. NPDC004068]|uniref:HAD family hydrolase n=1 Tax=Nocardia sp. NPDC004068 TaxID=3364303 RepID=UPI0036797B91